MKSSLIILLLYPLFLHSQIINLSNNASNSIEPRLIANGNQMYAFWLDNNDGDYDIFYRSYAQGNWSSTRCINTPTNIHLSSACFDDSDSVNLLWVDGNSKLLYGRIYQSTLVDSTVIFENDTSRITFSSLFYNKSTGQLHASWDLRLGDTLYTCYSMKTRGDSWSDEQIIIAGGVGGLPRRAQVVADRNNDLLCLWFSADSLRVNMKKKHNGNWIDGPPLTCAFPGIGLNLVTGADDSLIVHVVSHPGAVPTCPCNVLLYSRWNGAEWSQPEIVPSQAHGYYTEHNGSVVSFSHNNVPVLTWEQTCWDINLYPYARFIGTAVKADTGWHVNSTIGASRRPEHPAIIIDSNDRINYVWQDSTDGDNDIYFYNTTLLTFVEPDQSLFPRQVLLNQNFPNPFNPTTTIRFLIPSRTRVTLTVFDLLGREVATLVDGMQDPGEKTTTFDGSNLASGVYFYRLKAGERIETKKAVLIK
jgi:hypothetical protein